MAGLGERQRRLARYAGRLEPEPETAPYYVRAPMGAPEHAPGWYMVRAGELVYLGYSAIDAETTLRQLLPAKKRGAAA